MSIYAATTSERTRRAYDARGNTLAFGRGPSIGQSMRVLEITLSDTRSRVIRGRMPSIRAVVTA